MKTRKKAKFFPYGMMMPTIVIFGLFMIYPVIYSFYLSFMEFSGGTYTFVGLQNYIELFKDPVFYKALFNTFFLSLIHIWQLQTGAERQQYLPLLFRPE